MHFRSEAVKLAVVDLQTAMQVEQKNERKKLLDEQQAFLDQSRTAVQTATSAGDLDVLLQALQENRTRTNNLSQQDPALRALFAQVEQSGQFLIQWQNYLSAQASGNLRQAQENLRALSNSNVFSLIPRSEILKRLSDLENAPLTKNASTQGSTVDAVDAILAKTDSLESISDALRELRAIQGNRDRYDRAEIANSLVQALTPIDRTYQDFKAGLTTNIDVAQSYSGTEIGAATVAKLRRDLLLLVLPRFVGASEAIRPNPDETVSDFLRRLAADAKDRGDFSVGIRVKEALRIMDRGQTFSNADQVGLLALVAGQNQEAAGQFMLAVISYQNALKSGSDLVPANLIGDRLAAIQSAHPKDYEAGMELFLAPPTFRHDPSPRFLPPGAPGFNGAPPAAPALLIPPAPTGSPSPSPKK